jgi:hypothetical protein
MAAFLDACESKLSRFTSAGLAHMIHSVVRCPLTPYMLAPLSSEQVAQQAGWLTGVCACVVLGVVW